MRHLLRELVPAECCHYCDQYACALITVDITISHKHSAYTAYAALALLSSVSLIYLQSSIRSLESNEFSILEKKVCP